MRDDIPDNTREKVRRFRGLQVRSGIAHQLIGRGIGARQVPARTLNFRVEGTSLNPRADALEVREVESGQGGDPTGPPKREEYAVALSPVDDVLSAVRLRVGSARSG